MCCEGEGRTTGQKTAVEERRREEEKKRRMLASIEESIALDPEARC